MIEPTNGGHMKYAGMPTSELTREPIAVRRRLTAVRRRVRIASGVAVRTRVGSDVRVAGRRRRAGSRGHLWRRRISRLQAWIRLRWECAVVDGRVLGGAGYGVLSARLLTCRIAGEASRMNHAVNLPELRSIGARWAIGTHRASRALTMKMRHHWNAT